MPQLVMYRPATPPPVFALEKGYSIRPIRADEGADWCRCCLNGQLGIDDCTQAIYDEKMGSDPNLPEGSVFVVVAPDGRVAGTAAGLSKAEADPSAKGMGGLHMVGIDEAYRGHGLCAPLCARVIEYMWNIGLQTSRLSTDDFRVPAVKTYLKLGYLPIISDGDMADRWNAMYDKIGWKGERACVDTSYAPMTLKY